MNEKIIKNKIEKALEIICPLYKNVLITDAFIVGSVARGTARKESDIDIVVINPLFIGHSADLPPIPTILPYTPSEEENQMELLRSSIVDVLIHIGVEFKEIPIKEFPLWYQFYKGEIFHLLPAPNKEHIKIEESIEIKIDLCQ